MKKIVFYFVCADSPNGDRRRFYVGDDHRWTADGEDNATIFTRSLAHASELFREAIKKAPDGWDVHIRSMNRNYAERVAPLPAEPRKKK